MKDRLTNIYNKGFAAGRHIGCNAGLLVGAFSTYVLALILTNMFPDMSVCKMDSHLV
jgi:hypothetical protein